MNKEWYEKEWYEDDSPRDLSKYMSMSKEELDAEIKKMEAEARSEKERIEREKKLAVV